VVCSDLVDWFYSYFEFTKLWDRQAIATAIAKAISGAELGYVVGLIQHEGQLLPRDKRQIRFDDRVSHDEIDLSPDAALLWDSYAREILETPPAIPQDEPTGSTPIANPSKPLGSDEDKPAPEQPGTGETGPDNTRNTVSTAAITADITKPGLFNLGRALSWLREHADDVQVEINIRAEGEFDAVECRNRLVEPLEEATPDITVRLE
jgi:hypothetical protein